MHNYNLAASILFTLLAVLPEADSAMNLNKFNSLFSFSVDRLKQPDFKIATKNAAAKIDQFHVRLQQPKRTQSSFMIMMATDGVAKWHPTQLAQASENPSPLSAKSALMLDDGRPIPQKDIIDWCYADNYILHGGFTIKLIHSKFNLERQFKAVDSGIQFAIPSQDYDEDSDGSQMLRHIGNHDLAVLRRMPNVKQLVNLEHLANFEWFPHSSQIKPTFPIIYAARRGTVDVVRYLVDSGADANCVGRSESTAQKIAAAQANLALAKFLLENGADVNFTTSKGKTSLWNAMFSGNVELCTLLVTSGGDIKFEDYDGNNATHCLPNNLDMLELLVRNGVDLNHKNKQGRTPLHHAAFNGFKELCKGIVRNGADPTQVDDSGKTAYQYIADACGEQEAHRVFGIEN